MKHYDDYTIREALHNCIAHQDYTMQQRINFVENPTYLFYSNAGNFIPGTLENALANEEPQAYFRNECLCRAMVDFNMIDTVSRGIKKCLMSNGVAISRCPTMTLMLKTGKCRYVSTAMR